MLHFEPCSPNTYSIPVTSTVKLGRSFTYVYSSYKGGKNWKSSSVDENL